MKRILHAYKQARSGIPVLPQLGILGVILVLLFAGSIGSISFLKSAAHDDISQETNPSPIINEEPVDIENYPKNTNTSLESVELTASAAYVWDVRNQRALYTQNSREKMPLASITKLMTALLASEIMNQDDSVIIDEVASKQDGWSSLQENETFAFSNLLDFALMTSANEGAYALAATAGTQLTDKDPAYAFVEAMNIRAEELGLRNTTFYNPTGLDINEEQAGAYGTAEEVSYLLEYIITNKPDLLAQTTETETLITNETGGVHNARNTNYFLEQIPQLLASKTGYTELAGGNLTIAFDAGLNRPIIVTVLGSTRNDRFLDVLTLVEATANELAL